MSRKSSILAVILALSLLTSIIPLQVSGAEVSETSHSPDVPKSGEAVEISVTLVDVTNVTGVSMIYCSIDPFLCEMPVDMSPDTSNANKFKYTITKEYDPGMQVGYKFKISYQSGSPESVPKSQADSSIHPVAGPFEGSFYFVYSLESPAAEPFPIYLLILLIIIPIVVIVAVVVLMKRKGKGKKDEGDK
jgi:hypothetical protein